MILLYPLVLVGAAILIWKSRERALGSRGPLWFLAWGFAGALFMFSLATGFSIGLFLFPAAAFAILWLAVHAPYGREVSGFLVGLGAVALVVALI